MRSFGTRTVCTHARCSLGPFSLDGLAISSGSGLNRMYRKASNRDPLARSLPRHSNSYPTILRMSIRVHRNYKLPFAPPLFVKKTETEIHNSRPDSSSRFETRGAVMPSPLQPNLLLTTLSIFRCQVSNSQWSRWLWVSISDGASVGRSLDCSINGT